MLEEYQEQYLASLAMKGYSRWTIRNKRYVLLQFNRILCISSHRVTRRDMEPYLVWVEQKGTISAVTRRQRLLCLRGYYRWLKDQGIILFDPTREIPIPKRPKTLPCVPSREMIDRVLTRQRGNEYWDVLGRAVLEVLYSTGIRRRELLSLALDDVDMAQRRVRIRHAKGARERIVPVGVHAYQALSNYVERRRKKKVVRDREALFVNLGGRRLTAENLYWIFRRVRPSGRLTPHGLRHACAVGMLRNGADMVSIKTLLGHRRLTTTQLYTQLTIADVKTMCEKHHPRHIMARQARAKAEKRPGEHGERVPAGLCKKYYHMT